MATKFKKVLFSLMAIIESIVLLGMYFGGDGAWSPRVITCFGRTFFDVALTRDRLVYTKETWPLKKMYISCTGPSCLNCFPDFLLVKQNSFTTACPMNCQNKLVWHLGSIHKIHIHLEATSPFIKKYLQK